MANPASSYERLGVSASKEDVHAALAHADEGLFPGAFCRIGPDVLAGDPAWCAVLHSDGAGTKALVAYLIYRETNDASIFRGIAQDSLVMNLDDLACIGACERFLLSNTIGRNTFYIKGDVLREIIAGYEAFTARLRSTGIDVVSTGGETADLVDNVRTIVVDSTLATRLRRSDVIDNSRIQPGDAIVGLSSVGQATYEDRPNSGIGSNGLTLARHALLSRRYREQYPETVCERLDSNTTYRGPFLLSDTPGGLGMTIGEALTCPTRTYAPIIREVLSQLGPRRVHGMIHNTGGGLTKCLRFGKGIHYIKDRLFDCPPLFRLIAEHGGVSWREMYQTFNVGCRFEVIVAPADADAVIASSRRFGIDAKVIGRCDASDVNRVTLRGEFGDIES